MKKFIPFLVCLFVFFLFQQSKIVNNEVGTGTLTDPIKTSNQEVIQILEGMFSEQFESLMIKSDIDFNENTDLYWKATYSGTERIQIKSIHYLGTNIQASYLIAYICDSLDPKMKLIAPNDFKNEKFVLTSSDYAMDIDFSSTEIDTNKFNNLKSDSFSEKIADDILNDHAKMIVEYCVFHNDKWYVAQSLIDEEDPSYLLIPNTTGDYGIGEIIY